MNSKLCASHGSSLYLQKILIVDDVPENIEVLYQLLKDRYKLFGATTGKHAIEMAASLKPALILLDVIMPEMDGYEVCAALKSDVSVCDIPVIFITAKTDAESEKRALSAGAVDFIHKPLNTEVVLARVKLHLEMAQYRDDLEQRVEQRTQELQETKKQWLHAEKMSVIGKLYASIAHEFNNPLQGILTILKGVKKRASMDEEDKKLLDLAIDEGCRIKDLILNLQEFNRPSSGSKTLMDLHRTLDALLMLQKSDLKGRRITVVRDYAEQLPQIMAVSDQIKQVLLNLLANAADACPQYGGVITVSTWQENDSRVAVAIKDTGMGIKPENMEQIFQPFYSTKNEAKGTGLGLSVSHDIIQAHQGEIRVECRPGEGATLTVLLPL